MAKKHTPPQDLQKRPGVQDLDPALAERLHQLRQALGLSVGDMAQRLGLWGANGADNLRQMERCTRALPGTLQVLLGYMERELQSLLATRQRVQALNEARAISDDIARLISTQEIDMPVHALAHPARKRRPGP